MLLSDIVIYAMFVYIGLAIGLIVATNLITRIEYEFFVKYQYDYKTFLFKHRIACVIGANITLLIIVVVFVLKYFFPDM